MKGMHALGNHNIKSLLDRSAYLAVDLHQWDGDVTLVVVENKDTMIVWFLDKGEGNNAEVQANIKKPQAA